MHKTHIAIAAFIAALLSYHSTCFAVAAFQETGGQVVMDAEHYDTKVPRNGQDWVLNTTLSGFAGSGYMESLPNSGVNLDTGYVTTSPELVYNVQFATPGTYYVWIRGSANSGTDDSLHTGIDGTGPASADRIGSLTTTSWVWIQSTMDAVPATLVVPSAGVHTIHIWMREDGSRVDKILLRTSSSTTAPSGTGPAESARVSGDTTPPTISGIATSSITSTTATITWTTNEASTSQVDYGLTTSYGQTTSLDPTPVTSHSVLISGLTAATAYHYRVKSADAAGNSSTPNDSTFSTTAAPVMAFQETGGQVVMEAENYDQKIVRSGIDWVLHTSQTGFVGAGYMETSSNTGASNNSSYTTLSPELIYRVRISTPGTYYVWVRGYAAGGGDDTIHSGIDKTAPSSADRIGDFPWTVWGWVNMTKDAAPATLVISTAGVHTFHLWMREDGFICDRVLLRLDSSSTAPSGNGPAESARTDGTNSLSITDINIQPSGPLYIGNTLIVTPTVSNSGSGLEFQFQFDGTIVQPWSSSNTFSRAMTASDFGKHQIKVGVRNGSSQNQFQKDVYIYQRPLTPS